MGRVDAGRDKFPALLGKGPSHINHVCFTLEESVRDGAVSELEAVGLGVIRSQDRVFFLDPDGHLLQVSEAGIAEAPFGPEELVQGRMIPSE